MCHQGSFWDLTIATGTAGVSFRILSRPNAPWALRLMGGGKNADQGRPWYLWRKGTPHSKATRLDQVNSPIFFGKPNLISKSKGAKQMMKISCFTWKISHVFPFLFVENGEDLMFHEPSKN